MNPPKFDPNNLKIAHKGFVLASIPLLLGLVFLGCLMYLLNQAEQDAQREVRSQTINYESNLLTQDIIESVSVMSTYALTKQVVYLERYDETQRKANQSHQTLLELVRSNPEQTAMLEHMRGVQKRLNAMLEQLRDSRLGSFGDMNDFANVLGVRQQLQGLVQEYFRENGAFREAEKAELTKRSLNPAQSRLRVKQFVWLGILATVLIGASLVYFFSRSITLRIGTVMDNALRLASKKPLNPALEGTDEIAHLDAIFHTVAGVLDEAALRERAVVDNAVDVICSIDSGNRFMQVSPACKTVWGYAPEELLGRRVMDIVSSDDADKTLAALSHVSESHSSTLCENRVRKIDNTLVDMLWSMYWSAEQKTYFCVAHDITERKAAEDRVKESEATVKLIIESLPVALIISDSQGIVETNNMRTQQMFGYRGNELSGKHLRLLLDVGMDQSDAEFIQTIREKSLGQVSELDALRKDGSHFPVELSVTAFDSRGTPKLLTVALDVTERHEIERMKKEFVQMVSHDLRSPLTSVKGVMSLFHSGLFGAVNEQGKQMLERSESDVDRLVGLIDQLLDLERMQAGKMQIDYEVTDLTSVIERSVSAISFLASKNNIKIETPTNSPEVFADGSKLVQVIVNLLSNAIKFSPPNSTITITCNEIPEFVEVRIRDQGRGIPASLKDRIFERFEQVESADYKQKGGRGLGLAICKAIINSHHGMIGVDSEEGRGSTFWFRIPQPT